MEKRSLKSQLKDQLTKNSGEVLQILRQIFDNNQQYLKEVLVNLAEYNRLKSQDRSGTRTQESLSLSFNKLNSNIFDLIDLITAEEAAAYELGQSIFQHILVVCKSADRKEYMKGLFPAKYYKQLGIDATGTPMLKKEVDVFDLIIFDNHPAEGKDGPNTLLKYYLKETTPYLLYFGPNLPFLYDYPDRAYFTNSVFSIHARVREMIEYLKYKESH